MRAFTNRSYLTHQDRENEPLPSLDWPLFWRFLVLIMAILALVLAAVISLVSIAKAADHSVPQHGKASWYWQPQKLACGGRLSGRGDTRMWAASRRFPCGAQLRVTYGKRTVDVTVVDAGPYVKGRVIDLFPAPARQLGMTGRGVVSVTVEAF